MQETNQVPAERFKLPIVTQVCEEERAMFEAKVKLSVVRETEEGVENFLHASQVEVDVLYILM